MGKNGKIHSDVLCLSTVDTVELGRAVDIRFRDLLDAYFRINGYPLPPPVQLDADMLLWRTMWLRHRSGDIRNTASELRSTKTIAQWTVDIQTKLRNQPPIQVQWKE